MDEARLEAVESGLVPAGEGWFVVNVADAAWLRREGMGARCVFEADGRLVGGMRLEARSFEQLGFKLAVIPPGEPSTMYHAESQQEDFLVLAGECVAIVEDEERRLRAWDFLHCPPGTAHAFVGAGDEPCVVLMVGARREDGSIVYSESALAQSHGASVERETDSPDEAYAAFPPWERARPDGWEGLPWG